MANKGAILQGVRERLVLAILGKLNVDPTGRLRVGDLTLAASQTLANVTTVGTVSTVSTVSTVNTVTAVTTCGTVTNLTNWGLSSAQAKSQWESHMAYGANYRRNLVHS